MSENSPVQYLMSNVSCTRNQQISGPNSELVFETLAPRGMPLKEDNEPRVGVAKNPDCECRGYLTEVESRLPQLEEFRVLVSSLRDDNPRKWFVSVVL